MRDGAVSSRNDVALSGCWISDVRSRGRQLPRGRLTAREKLLE